MRVIPIFLCCVLGTAANAQTAAHVHQTTVAYSKGQYAINDGNCETPAVDVLGWSRSMIKKCTYSEGAGAGKLSAVVYLLEVSPDVTARWIETACKNQLPTTKGCFQTVLRHGHENSGMMFPISGNLIENMNGPWKNYFFRNGMTVQMAGKLNGTGTNISIANQDLLALEVDDKILSIPSGKTRFWRTKPFEFANLYPDSGAPRNLSSPKARQQWLTIAQTEMIASLMGPRNKLLEAWVSSCKAAIAREASGTRLSDREWLVLCPTDS